MYAVGHQLPMIVYCHQQYRDLVKFPANEFHVMKHDPSIKFARVFARGTRAFALTMSGEVYHWGGYVCYYTKILTKKKIK